MPRGCGLKSSRAPKGGQVPACRLTRLVPLLALAAALLLLLPWAAKLQTARPPDAPAKPGSKTGRPSGPANYSQALKQWRRVEDISRWIGRHFIYDRQRALRLSESQRARRGRVVIFPPERFFQRPRGVCVDLARFGLETARRVEPASKPEYLLIVFEPRVMGGEVFRRHWLVLFQRQGRYYYFADSRRPGQVAGPHVSLTSLLKKYAAFRQRKIVSFRLLTDYKKRNRQKRRYRRGKRSLPQKR